MNGIKTDASPLSRGVEKAGGGVVIGPDIASLARLE